MCLCGSSLTASLNFILVTAQKQNHLGSRRVSINLFIPMLLLLLCGMKDAVILLTGEETGTEMKPEATEAAFAE